jgi:hypothetical protein
MEEAFRKYLDAVDATEVVHREIELTDGSPLALRLMHKAEAVRARTWAAYDALRVAEEEAAETNVRAKPHQTEQKLAEARRRRAEERHKNEKAMEAGYKERLKRNAKRDAYDYNRYSIKARLDGYMNYDG